MKNTISIYLPESLRNISEAPAVVKYEAGSVLEAIIILLNLYPDLKQFFIDENADLQLGGIILYLNNVQLNTNEDMKRNLQDGDELFILIPISG